jgi:hypothetical protein
MGGATEAGKTFGTVMVAAIKIVETAAYGLAAVFEGVRSVVAGVLYVIVSGVQNIVQSLAFVSEKLDLGFAGALRSASDTLDAVADSLDNVSTQARDNAAAAGSEAVRAATQIVQASTIFATAQAEYERKAAEAAARSGSAQGAITGTGAGFNPDATRGGTGLSKDTLGVNPEKFDPLADPRVLQELQINDALAAIQDAHDSTMLGKLEAFNETRLGSLLSYNDMMLAAEDAKNMNLGEMGNSLAQMAMQQGGKLGKIGKAYAIAQTVWSTGTAIMKAMAEVPYPANIAAAAVAAAMGVAQLSNIKKTNLGGSGAIARSSGGGSVATSSALPDNPRGVQQSQPEDKSVSQIVIQGNVFSSQETADWIIEQIRDAVNTRDVTFINANSRQAMDLAGVPA